MNSFLHKKSLWIFLSLLAVAVGIFVLLLFSGVLTKLNRRNTTDRIPASEETFESSAEGPDTIQPEDVIFNVDGVGMMADDDIKNILLIGQDRREGEDRQRSDSMIICSINTRDEKIKLVSLMRDMYVPIPGYSANRINAAYAFGGMDLLDETIEQDFGIPIDGNVEVDFDGFVEALAVLGDLEIELTAEEAGYLNGGGWEDQGEYLNDGSWDLQEGVNALTPAQALAYSRIRYIGNSDWERTERQRKVIITAFQKIGSSSTAKMLSVADKIFPYITTDLSNSEMLSYVKTLSVHEITEIESYRLPVEGYYSSETINGMSVLVPDLVMNSQFLKQYLYGVDVDESLATDNYVPKMPTPEPVEPVAEVEETTPYVQPTFYNQPSSGGSATPEPSVPEPVYTEPVYEEPVYEEPVYEDPAYEEPVYEDPAYEEPVYEDPVEEPVYEEPSYSEEEGAAETA